MAPEDVGDVVAGREAVMTYQRILERKLPLRIGRWAKYLLAADVSLGVDAFWLAAIMDRESHGGDWLIPKGPTGLGDNGHAYGLMQIDIRYHKTFLAALGPDGKPLWQKPEHNILYAASLLLRNLEACGHAYAPAVAAYNAPLEKVLAALEIRPDLTPVQTVPRLDALTTGKDYVSDVIRRYECFMRGEDPDAGKHA